MKCGAGHDYVQFEYKDSMQKCLDQQKGTKLQINGKDLNIIAFEKSDNR